MHKKDIGKDIIKKIYRGIYDVGQKIPSISEGSKIYGVSQSSIKDVYNSLYKIGVLKKQRGKGFYITEYWNANIISSPTLEDNISKTDVFFDDEGKKFINDYKDLLEKTKKGKWFSFVKFYYNNNLVIKFNIVIVNKYLIRELSIKDIQGSFISWLYNNDYFPQNELVETSIRKATNKEWKILKQKSKTIVEENIETFNQKNKVICFSKWIINTNFYSVKRLKENY